MLSLGCMLAIDFLIGLSSAFPITLPTTKDGFNIVTTNKTLNEVLALHGNDSTINITTNAISTAAIAVSTNGTTNGDPDPEAADVVCFNPIPGLDLRKAKRRDCETAASLIAIGSKSSAPVTWSNVRGAAVEIPHTWEHKSCRIDIQPEHGKGVVEDTFSYQYVSDVADQILGPCIYRSNARLGGSTILGDAAVIRLTVHGPIGGAVTSTE